LVYFSRFGMFGPIKIWQPRAWLSFQFGAKKFSLTVPPPCSRRGEEPKCRTSLCLAILLHAQDCQPTIRPKMWNGNNVNRQTITRWLRPVHKIDFGQSYLCALTPNWTLSYKQGSEASGLSTCGELGPRVEIWFIGGTFTPVVKTLR
jgi:hypothetical protein